MRTHKTSISPTTTAIANRQDETTVPIIRNLLPQEEVPLGTNKFLDFILEMDVQKRDSLMKGKDRAFEQLFRYLSGNQYFLSWLQEPCSIQEAGWHLMHGLPWGNTKKCSKNAAKRVSRSIEVLREYQVSPQIVIWLSNLKDNLRARSFNKEYCVPDKDQKGFSEEWGLILKGGLGWDEQVFKEQINIVLANRTHGKAILENTPSAGHCVRYLMEENIGVPKRELGPRHLRRRIRWMRKVCDKMLKKTKGYSSRKVLLRFTILFYSMESNLEILEKVNQR